VKGRAEACSSDAIQLPDDVDDEGDQDVLVVPVHKKPAKIDERFPYTAALLRKGVHVCTWEEIQI